MLGKIIFSGGKIIQKIGEGEFYLENFKYKIKGPYWQTGVGQNCRTLHHSHDSYDMTNNE